MQNVDERLLDTASVPPGSRETVRSFVGGDVYDSLADLDAESAAAKAEVLAVSSAALACPASCIEHSLHSRAGVVKILL